MSQPNRPAYQKATKSSSSSVGGAPGGARWNTYAAGVSPVRGLSPVKSTFHGVARQEIDSSRSHTNPLFARRTSDVGRTPTKAFKEHKENREKQEPWNMPVEKAQYSGKTLCTTPGKTTPRNTASMRFTTPPKPIVKRKILAENRESTAVPPRVREEEIKKANVAPPSRKEVITQSAAVPETKREDTQSQTQSGLTSCSSEHTSADSVKPKSPLASIEELQKRIQKFLQDEETSADVTAPLSPIQCPDNNNSLRGLCGPTGDESSVSGVEEAPYHPLFAPYSPRPEFLCARKSPTSAPLEGNVSPLGGDDSSACQEKTTPTYDPKNNFLSPRPQFLRYRPLRRLELLRKSAEGLLGDLDLESPATDADSSRVGSEKEDSELQDVSQEVQSLKSSSECLQRKGSSPELFQPTEKHGEIVGQYAGPIEQNFNSMKPSQLPQAADEVKFPCVRSECENLELEDEEGWPEDASSSSLNFVCGIVTLALLALVLVISGSPALLPESLHQNRLSHLWKTSKTTEPFCQFLQTTDALWGEGSNPVGYSSTLPSAGFMRVGYMHFKNFIQSERFDPVVKIGNVVLDSCIRYGAVLQQHVKGSYAKFRASLESFVDYLNNSQTQEVNEWDWVPDYDFVVPHHMFDPIEAYGNIMAWMESFEVKSFWSSLLQSHANHAGAKSITRLLEEEVTDQSVDGSIEGRNSSICLLPARVGDQAIRSFSLPALVGSVSPRKVIEFNSNIPRHSEEKELQEPNSPADVIIVTDSLPELILSEVHNAEVRPSIVMDESPLSLVIEDTQHLHVTEGAQLPHVTEQVELLNAMEEGGLPHAVTVQLSESTFGTGQPFSSQSSHGESSDKIREAAGLAVPSHPMESGIDAPKDVSYVSQAGVTEQENDPSQEKSVAACGEDAGFEAAEGNDNLQKLVPRTTRSSLLRKLGSAPGFRTSAAILLSLLVVAGAALLAIHRKTAVSGKVRPANLNESRQQGFSMFSPEPHCTEVTNTFEPLERNTGSNFLTDDSHPLRLSSNYIEPLYAYPLSPDPVTVYTPDRLQTSSDFVDQFSTPKPVTVCTPEIFQEKASDKDFLSLDRSFKHAKESLQTLEMEAVEDSSLGRFVAFVPVVTHEGTDKEQVKLTPVRRSSRIRTRMQSPCNSMHSSHHLCSCEKDNM